MINEGYFVETHYQFDETSCMTESWKLTRSPYSQYDRDTQQLMYEVPGYGEPNIDRYLKAKKKNQSALERLTLKSRFTECTDPSDEYKLLKDALTSTDIQWQIAGAELVSCVKSSARNELQSLVDQASIQALSSENPEEQIMGARMVRYVSDRVSHEAVRYMSSSIDTCIKNKNALIQKIGAEMMKLLPEDDRPKLEAFLLERITAQLSSHDSQQQIDAAKLIRYVSDDTMPKLITNVLNGNNIEAQIAVVPYLKRFKAPVATPLLRQVFHLNDPYLSQVAAEATTRIFRTRTNDPEVPSDISDAITQTTRDALTSNDTEMRKIGTDMLKDVANARELAELVRSGMNSDDIYVKTKAVKAIRYMCTDTTYSKGTASNLIRQALQSSDHDVQKAAVAVARHVPEPEKSACMEMTFALVNRLIHSQNKEEQKRGAEMAYHVTHPGMETLFTIIESDPELVETLMFSRLYPHEHSAPNFQRRIDFAKTGSKMTILRGGTLERRLLIRHIEKKAFLAWMHAHEQYDVWLDAGFDYIPVEPIQSFAFRENTVDVFAGLLDIDLKHWLTVSGGRFKQELLDKRDQIISVLRQLGIRHGDLHWGNFFLKFPRRPDGSIDTQILPHIYVGDFDKSQIKTHLKSNTIGQE